MVCLGFGAGLVSAVLGCGGSHSDENGVVRSAVTTATDVFGFEDPTDWSTTTAGALLTRSTTHSQGSFSLQVKPSSSNGFTPIVSVPLSTLAVVSPTLAWDVMLPTQQPNRNWFGTAQMYLNCPSRNINSQFLGQVELTGKPLNVWNTISFSLTAAEVTGLLKAGYTDLTITVVLNVPTPTTGVYFIDNLRFIPLATNACGGWPNGTSCTDGNACTHTDTCQAGICKGSNPVVCTAQDQCHVVGTCNTTTGICSNPVVANGTTCNDGNACTQTDTCQVGVCSGSNPIVCPSLNQCNAGVCDPTSGACSTPPVADGTACDDGDACTSSDTCQSGVCGGTRDSLCALSIRFDELADLGNGVRAAIFSYTNPGAAVSAPYGSRNFISVDGQMVATPATTIPQAFGTGDHPGALAYPLPAGTTTVSWTVGGHVSTSTGSAVPLGTTSTGAPAVAVTDIAGHTLTVAFDPTNVDVVPTVVLTVTPGFVRVPQGGTAAATINVERVGGFSDPVGFGITGQVGISAGTLPVGAEPAASYTLTLSAGGAAPLGAQEVTVSAFNFVADRPTANLALAVVSPPVSTVAIASLSMKAPLTLQGAQSWGGFSDIDNTLVFNGGIEAWNNYTSTPIPPFIFDPNAPRWVKGNGFTVQDELGLPTGVSGVPKVIVQNSQVNFEVGLKLTDDTSALAITATADALDRPQDDPINIGTGVTSCTTSLFPGVVEGNHGKYTVRIERWDNTATNCQPDEHPDPDYPLDGVTFAGPTPDGFAGCWVALNSTATDLYSSQPLPDIKGAGIHGQTAPRDGTLSGTMNVLVSLPGVATFLRYVVELEEADTRVPTDTDIVGWDTSRRYPDADSCVEENNIQLPPVLPFMPLTAPTTGQGFTCPIGQDPNNFLWDSIVPFCPPAVGKVVVSASEFANEGPVATWRFNRPLVNGSPQQQTFVYEQASSPFQVVVEPLAVAQMKVLPLTILYQPPGDKSTAQYTLSNSFGTTMTASNLVTQGQSTSVDSKAGDGTTVSFKSLAGKSDGSAVGDFLANFSVSGMTSSSETWDHTTNVGTGRSSTAAMANTATFAAVKTTTIGPNKNLIPGAAGTFAQEPFWDDTFATIVHPQVGVWRASGSSAIILLGADGQPSSPALFFVTTRELDQCARQVAPFPNGILINTSTHTPPDATDVLDANDCLQLVQLDPFYGVGQSLPGVPTARVVQPTNAVTSTNFGTALDGQPLNQSLSNVITYANVSTATNVATYNASVTDAFMTSDSGGVTFSLYGFSFGLNFSQSGSTSNVNTWAVTFQSSFAATVQSSIGIQGLLSDDHPTAQFPAVFMFQDTAFGGFMFQDPAAPGP
jgi:hypothetical protein